MPDINVSLFDMLTSISGLIDLVDTNLLGHHKRVAYIAVNIAKELGLSIEEQNSIMIAALLHDTGALSLKERLDALNFETEHAEKHAELGYHLINGFKYFKKPANLIRFHHHPWNNGKGDQSNGIPVNIGSHIIHLSDRVDTLLNKNSEVLSQTINIKDLIKSNSGTKFAPDIVQAFLSIAKKEAFWLDIMQTNTLYFKHMDINNIMLNYNELLDVTKLYVNLIDFRSRFTATHSSGVASVAETIARHCGMNTDDCQMMKMAGYMHDLGKLAVPPEILEKPGKLATDEFNIIKCHTYYTYQILSSIEQFKTINEWASYHHEQLDGEGYPFHLKGDEIPFGSRVICISDIFTALTEDRPYRNGMDPDKALKIMCQMADNGKIDGDILSILKENRCNINSAREQSQKIASSSYINIIGNHDILL